MQITSNEIRTALRGIWPKIQFIWLQDRIYIKPSIKEVEGFIIASEVFKLRFNGELMDCDDYSLLLNAYVKRQRIDMGDTLSAEDNFHLAFGEAFGDEIRGIENHTVNICVAQEGVFLIEPQTCEYWQPTNNDSILLVKM